MDDIKDLDIKEICSVLKTLIENQRLIIDVIKELRYEQENIKEEIRLNNMVGANIISRREMMN